MMWREPAMTYEWAVFAGEPGEVADRGCPEASGTCAEAMSDAYAVADAYNQLFVALLGVGGPGWGEIVTSPHWSALPERVAFIVIDATGRIERRPPADAPGRPPWTCGVTMPHEPHPCAGWLDHGTTYQCPGVAGVVA